MPLLAPWNGGRAMRPLRPNDDGDGKGAAETARRPEGIEDLGVSPDDLPTWGPVEYDEVTGAPLLPDNLGDPTRRKHPTILSAEGEAEAPDTELPDEDAGR